MKVKDIRKPVRISLLQKGLTLYDFVEKHHFNYRQFYRYIHGNYKTPLPVHTDFALAMIDETGYDIDLARSE